MFSLSVLVTYFIPRAHKENYVSYNTIKKNKKTERSRKNESEWIKEVEIRKINS